MTSIPPSVKFKVVLLGSQGVGKTCLFNRIVNDKFSDKYQATVAGIFKGKFFSYHGQTIEVGIWDTVGTERYKSLNQMFYRGSKAAVVCYDICEARTWEDVKDWLRELRLHEEDCKIYLCGTKKDLVMEGLQQRAIQLEATSKHAAGIQAKIFEVSSKTGDNVVTLFQTIVDDYMESQEKLEQMMIEDGKISLTPALKKKRFFCC